MRKSVLALVLLVSAFAQAQTGLQWQQGLNPLNTGWRTHAGDNPAWAAPAFNDSGWQLAVLDEPLPSTPGKDDERWYRLRINLPAEHPPLALLEVGGEGMYEVYLNGKLLPGARLRSPWGCAWRPVARGVQIDDAATVAGSGPSVLAVHTRVPNNTLFHPLPAGIGPWVSIGTRGAIEDAASARRSVRLRGLILRYGIAALLVLAAIPLVLLSRLQRNHREYLWVGLNLLCLANVDIALSPALFVFLELPAIYLAPITQVEFAFSFAGRPVTRIWRVYQAVIVVGIFTLLPLLWIGKLDFFPYQAIEAALLIPAMAILPVLLFAWYRQGNREAGWLIVPSLFPLLSICVVDLGLIGTWLGLRPLAALLNPIPVGSFSVFPPEPANLLYLFAIGIVIFLRFNRVSHQQARAASEFEAAQRVQSLLLRSAHAQGTRFRIEAVYRPAAEVGGDFFHAAEIDAVTRIVVGDVSGKGLGAAMLVSALIGALDANRDTDPSAVLKQLNEMLLLRQQGGFTTCLLLRADPSGTLTIANAGHLAPYIDGCELTLENGLPLGLSADGSYAESTFTLAPGAQLTMLTDGVAEARSPSGELFGFDRAAAISTQSAEEIAHAAQQFGQEDDITVLTLAFAPAEVLHA
jgi:hypothetical protein